MTWSYGITLALARFTPMTLTNKCSIKKTTLIVHAHTIHAE